MQMKSRKVRLIFVKIMPLVITLNNGAKQAS
jgi:hypothetical protein